MRIVEFFHDEDHPELSNIDLWIQEYNHQSQKALVYKGDNFPELDSFDLILLHGGAQHLWNKDADPWLHVEVDYIRKVLKANKPVIGFCLGSQIIADALGAKIYPDEAIEFGWIKVIVKPEAEGHVVLKGLEEGFVSFMWHRDHYELPENCVSLAYTSTAANQIFISNSMPAVGFQFHPEYTREIVKTYYQTYRGTEYLELPHSLPIDEFNKNTDALPDTYLLFRQLLNNAVRFLNLKNE